MSPLIPGCEIVARPHQPQRVHATVEDVTEDDSPDCTRFSSTDTTPNESRRNSFFGSCLTDEALVAYAAGIPLPSDLNAGLSNTAVGLPISRLNVPPNFARIMPEIYRSAFPSPENFSFLRLLGLKTILTLVPEEYSDAHQRFITENRIQHFQIGIEPNKSPFITISQCNMAAALQVALDETNHPMLIHCNKGKHRTGCVVACLRKILGWGFEDIINEYRKYASKKARVLDERFIELYDERPLRWMAQREQLARQVSIPEPFAESPVSSLSISTRLRS